MLTGAPDVCSTAAASATSRTRTMRARGQAARSIDSLSDGTCSPPVPTIVPSAATLPGGGQL